MIAAILVFLNNIKIYLYIGVAAAIAGCVALFIWRGHEIDSLQEKLDASQKTIVQYQNQANNIRDLRNFEIQSRKEADASAEEINNAPATDDGPVAPVLLRVLKQL